MAGRKEGIYGPVKAFSYLTGASDQNAPSGALRREGGMYGSNDNVARARTNGEYGSQASNINRQSLYPPDRETGQADYQRDLPGYRNSYATDSNLGYAPQGQDYNRGRYGDYSNSGYDDNDTPEGSRRGGYTQDRRGDGERHPMSPQDHPDLFSNFILKGPGKDSSTDHRPSARDSPRPAHKEYGESESRLHIQDLFSGPSGDTGRGNDRHTKHSSQASSTAGLLSPDRSSSSASDYPRTRADPYVARSHSPMNELRVPKQDNNPYNYDRKLPRTDASDPTPGSFFFSEPEVDTRAQQNNRNHHGNHKTKSHDTEFFPQIKDDPYGANSPKIRPSTQESDFNTLMRSGGAGEYVEKKRKSVICTAVAVCIVVALICLGAGFVAGWFGYKEAHSSDIPAVGLADNLTTTTTTTSTITSTLSTTTTTTTTTPDPTTAAQTTQPMP